MKKKMIFTTLFIVVFAFTCVYNVCFVSNSNKKLSDLTLEGIEAIASPEISDNDCIESKTSIRTETLSDGAVRLFVGYTCGYLPGGPCKKGTVVEYYNANGKYIGQDDQRTNLYCF